MQPSKNTMLFNAIKKNPCCNSIKQIRHVINLNSTSYYSIIPFVLACSEQQQCVCVFICVHARTRIPSNTILLKQPTKILCRLPLGKVSIFLPLEHQGLKSQL